MAWVVPSSEPRAALSSGARVSVQPVGAQVVVSALAAAQVLRAPADALPQGLAVGRGLAVAPARGPAAPARGLAAALAAELPELPVQVLVQGLAAAPAAELPAQPLLLARARATMAAEMLVEAGGAAARGCVPQLAAAAVTTSARRPWLRWQSPRPLKLPCRHAPQRKKTWRPATGNQHLASCMAVGACIATVHHKLTSTTLCTTSSLQQTRAKEKTIANCCGCHMFLLQTSLFHTDWFTVAAGTCVHQPAITTIGVAAAAATDRGHAKTNRVRSWGRLACANDSCMRICACEMGLLHTATRELTDCRQKQQFAGPLAQGVFRLCIKLRFIVIFKCLIFDNCLPRSHLPPKVLPPGLRRASPAPVSIASAQPEGIYKQRD